MSRFADSGREPAGRDAPMSGDARSGGRAEEAGPWSRTARGGDAPRPAGGDFPRRDNYAPPEGGFRGDRGEGGYGGRGGAGGGRGYGARRDEPADDVDDKWSKAFGGRTAARAPDAPPARNFDGPSRGFDGPPRGGFDRPSDRSAPLPTRSGAGWGGGGDAPPRREYEGGAPRREFDGPPRGRGDFDGGRGGGGGRGGSGYPGGRRRDDDEVIDDPRFANKFGSGGRGGGGGGGGGRGFGGDARNERFERSDRGGRYQRDDPSRYAGPLPTAPRGSVDADRQVEVVEGLLGQVRVKEAKKEKKAEPKEVKEVAKPKVDISAKEAAKEAAEAAAAAEKAAQEAFSATVTELLSSGLRGPALTAALKEKFTKIYPAQLMTAVLHAHADIAADNWWDDATCGAVLKASAKSVSDQAMLVFGVQQYCADKKFAKVTVKGTAKKLIDLLFNTLLKYQIVDVDGFVLWADDVTDRAFDGRTDAIVQTSAIIQTLRELDVEEAGEEEEDVDEQQAFVK